MKGNHLPFSALAIVAALAASGAAAQTVDTAHGRMVFDKKGCQSCHSYVSRRGAPSVRDMLRAFEGDPVRVLKGIGAVQEHRQALSDGKVSNAELRLLAEWLGADLLPDAEDEAPAQASGQGAAATASLPPATPATPAVSAPVLASPVKESAAAVPSPAAVAAVPELRRPASGVSGAAISGLRIQSFGESGGDRLIIELRGGEPEGVDMTTAGNRFVVSISGVGLAGIPTRIPADGAFNVIESVETRDDGHTVTITVQPRDTGWTYSGMQGRNRLVVDFAAQAKSDLAAKQDKTPAATPVAAQPAAAAVASPAKAPAGSAVAVGAGVAATGAAVAAKAGKATADKLAGKPSAGTGETSPPAGKSAVQSKPVAGKGVEQKTVEKAAVDPKVAESKAAELKASEQAKAQEAARKAELARAAEQAKAKEQAEAAARKREQERAAEAAKVPAPTLAKAEPTADAALTDASDGKDRRKLKKSRPYKEANLGPCPPPNPADQVIGVVDVERAKEIIDRIGCPQCHAYVQKKTGTPFREVLKKYKGDPACVIHRLKTNETHKDEGVTADIRADEFKILADYVATRLK